MKVRFILLAWGVQLLALPLAFAQTPGQVHGAPSTSDVKNLPCRERPVEPAGRPRIGLVLGGGGARGIAHISVLRKLEQMHIPIDCVAGTSMGALIGALYASGMSVDDIERTLLGLDWERLFNDSLERPERSYRRKRDDDLVIASPGIGVSAKGVKVAGGLLAGERIVLLFEKLIEPVSTIKDFDYLPIPYRAVAADINTGDAVVIGHGDLALAMRASMSIPGAFPPIQMGDHVLVDGGVARNIPIDVARAMGADIVIAVDVGTPLAKMTPDSNVLAITEQVTGLLTVRNTREQLATLTERDVLITPPLGNRVATADFSKGAEALAIGKQGADAATDQLARLSLPEAAYAQNRSVRTGRQATSPVVQFVHLDNHSQYRDELVLSRVNIPLGQPLDASRLEAKLYEVYGMNTLSQSTYEVVEEDGKTGVLLHIHDKIQGPNYLEGGLSTSGNFSGSSDMSVRLGVLQSPINDSGGEIRYLASLGTETGFLSEYYQPFGARGRYFFGARGQYQSYPINVFDSGGHRTSQYDTQQLGLNVTVGREFGNYGALLVGVERAAGNAREEIGDPAQPRINFQTGEVYADATIDRVDSFYFPREGYLLRTRYTWSRDAFGADSKFDQLDVDAVVARTFGEFGKHSVQLGLRYHVTSSGVAPIQSVYRLGGFARLVGYQPNELTGQDYAMLLAGYSYRIGRLLNQPALAGTMLEYGNAWQRRSDMAFDKGVFNGSVYVGLDSWIGPVLFGVGAREGGHQNVFLEIGHPF